MRRISDFIRQQVAIFLKKEIHDPRLTNVSITGVDVTPDLRHAKIYYTLLDKNQLEAVAPALSKASGYLKHLLAQDSPLRVIPQLHFVFDESIMHGEAFDKILEKIPDLKQENQSDPENPEKQREDKS